MKKLYWCVQQLDKIGGTEMVSINLMNALCDKYDITLISSAKVDDIVYDINKKIKIESLNLSKELCRYDQFMYSYREKHQYKKAFLLFLELIKIYVFKRQHIRKKLEKKIRDENNSLMICSSLDSYYFAPKKHHVYFHFHFSSEVFFSSSFQFQFKMFMRKPEKYIFLSKTIMDEVCQKRPKLRDKSLYIYNPVRFAPELDLSFHNNKIIFLGRFSEQKNPLLALRIANELNKEGFPFTLDMYGSGSLENKMIKYINDNKLTNVVKLYPPNKNIKDIIKKSDMLLLTSLYEGYVLARGECSYLSRPIVTSYWGDTVYEMVHEGIDGYVINSNNEKDFALKIKECLRPDNLLKLKRNNYNLSKNGQLSMESIKKQWYKIL